MQPNLTEKLRAPNLMFPVSRRELTPVRSVLSGCRGVVGLVPQPLCMKFKSAEADWNQLVVAHVVRICNEAGAP